MKIKSAAVARCSLLLGYILFLWSFCEVYWAPVLTSTIVPLLKDGAFTEGCENEFTSCICNEDFHCYPKKRFDRSPCPPCVYDAKCIRCMAGFFANRLIRIVLVLVLVSILTSPYETRTQGAYYRRLTLLLLVAILEVVVYAIFVCLLLMAAKKYWFPLPSRELAKKSTEYPGG